MKRTFLLLMLLTAMNRLVHADDSTGIAEKVRLK